MMISIYRSSKFAIQNFWRNLWLSVITIFILMLTLYTISLVATVNLLAKQAITAVQEKVDVNINFKAEATEDDVMNAKLFIEQIAGVKTVRYISPDEALKQFKLTHENDKEIQEALDELAVNPLPASLVVQADALDDYEKIINKFEQSKFEELVENKSFADHQTIIDRLSAIIQRLYQAGVVISLVFIIVSIIMMFNTIRIAIYTYREEMTIMKLVGATNWFIRAPLILEGVLYGVAASVLALGLLWVTVMAASPYVNTFFMGYNFNLNTFFYTNIWLIFVAQLLCSLLLAVGSSMISIGRYLKV
ncbi:MAG: permease-like cell division protein FtsX [Patescibacteria group bacterium]|jgi:cell division transport system permease protein